MYKVHLANWAFTKSYHPDHQIFATRRDMSRGIGRDTSQETSEQWSSSSTARRQHYLKQLHKYIKGRNMTEDEFYNASKDAVIGHESEQQHTPTTANLLENGWLAAQPRLYWPIEGGIRSAIPNSLYNFSTAGIESEKLMPLLRRSQEIIRSYLFMNIRGRTERALADTGAQENVMSEAFARELDLTVDKSEVRGFRFVNAIGETMKAIGHTTIHCGLGGHPTQSDRSGTETKFWVFSKLVEPLVVGRKFLESTETLTRFRHRLHKVFASRGSSLRILHMELPRWRINCTVNDRQVMANPDTGSDLDLVSLDYAQRCGLRIHRSEPDCQSVEFADLSQKKLAGFVLVPFQFGSSPSSNAEQVSRQFHVLEGLTSDILVGNNTLEDFDAFNTYRSEMVDLEEYDYHIDFHLIRWVQKSGNADFLDQNFRDIDFSLKHTGR